MNSENEIINHFSIPKSVLDKKRKYFYSQKVILWFILKRLGIDIEVPVLKNKERTKEQVLSMNELLPDE